MLGDWAPGSTLKPLRAITQFDPVTGAPTASIFECEVYAPSGQFIVGRAFSWTPRDPTAGATVQNLAMTGLGDIMEAEGLQPYTPSAP